MIHNERSIQDKFGPHFVYEKYVPLKSLFGMKKFLITILLIIPLWGQSQSMFELTGFGKVGFDVRSQYMYTAGTTFEWQPKSGNIGLNYSLRFGRNGESNFLFQCPISAVTSIVAVAILADYDGNLPGLGLLLCLIPEGLSYNIWKDDDIAFTPFINPLLIEFSRDHIGPVLETGVKMKTYFNEYLFGNIEGSLQMQYTSWVVNPWVGISIGVRF